MPIEHIPLIKIQRDLHDIPRGMERFSAYLNTIMNGTGDDVSLVPLVAMNPMGREHVAERLDEFLALDADTIAAHAVDEAQARLGDFISGFQHGLVILDDVRGGWTNRTVNDAAFRYGGGIPTKRKWITTAFWASESPSQQSIRQAVLASIYRMFYIQQHGVAKTLRQIMEQEGAVGIFAGTTTLHLDADDLDYSRHVLEQYLESSDHSVLIAALYGNNAAISLGYPPLGLSDNAGLEVALADALVKEGLSPS